MSNVVYLTKVDPANATTPPLTSETEQKPAPRFMGQMQDALRRLLAYAKQKPAPPFIGRMRDALGHLLAYADLLSRQQREIAALQARVERLEKLCERALHGDESA